jgi:hypothetical protein
MRHLSEYETFDPQSNQDPAKQLIYSLPEDVKKRFFGLWGIPQRPDYHPEGNTLKHVIMVVKRAMREYPDNMNIILAAIFHDIGKDETFATHPKTGHPTAYGHEEKSGDLVRKCADWITSKGGDPEVVEFIVRNHMKAHKMDQMRPVKQEVLRAHPSFPDLERFERLDRGGTDL